MFRALAAACFLLVWAGNVFADEPKLTVKVEKTEPPKELSEPVRKVLDSQAMNVLDDKGKVLCTVWVQKELEAKATADQVKAGLKYTNLEETTLIGAVKFPDVWPDYRKQKIKAGVYTLRLGIQPMDGDHMGTAPYNEFCLLSPADQDRKPETMEAKELQELAAKSAGRKHPGIMLLFPNKKPAEAPVVEAKPKEHTVLSFRIPASAGDQKANLGFSLVVVGQTMAE
jgi:hypothetical protein